MVVEGRGGVKEGGGGVQSEGRGVEREEKVGVDGERDVLD